MTTTKDDPRRPSAASHSRASILVAALALAAACEGDADRPPAGATNPDGGGLPAPATGQPAGAVAKFCNGLTSQMGPIELAIDIGNPPVRFTAATGQCAPALGQPCLGIAAGAAVPVDIYLNRVRIGQVSLEIPADQGIVLQPMVLMQNDTRALRLERSLYPPAACAQADPLATGARVAPP